MKIPSKDKDEDDEEKLKKIEEAERKKYGVLITHNIFR